MTTVVWQNQSNKITYKNFHTSDFLEHEEADKIGDKQGYGRTVIIRSLSSSFKNRVQQAIRDIFNGIRSGYPICCVVNFSIDALLARPSAQLRWNDITDYVPCVLHARAYGKKRIPQDLY